MLTKEEMMNEIIHIFGLEHSKTIAFCEIAEMANNNAALFDLFVEVKNTALENIRQGKEI